MAGAVKNLIPGFDPNRSNNYTLKPDTPAVTTGGDGGGTAGAGGGGTTTGNGGATTTTTPAPAGSFLSMTGPGWSGPSGQQISDWATVAGSNQPYAAAYKRATGQQTPADLVKMRADVEAARQRLGPIGATSADFAGTELNPTNLLTAVPYVGPGLAGGAQSAFVDYGEGKDWPTIGKDTLTGAAIGEASMGMAHPRFAGNTIARGIDVGGGMGIGELFGREGEMSIPGMIGAKDILRGLADKVGEGAQNALNNPTARRAVQQLLYGAGMTANQGRSFNNWIPGQ